ncbi:MAG: phosphoglucosamine mutase [Firmicutes bacterium]|nr:phosphoglucosamine mutase [Candidatus Fermentithermobacillaceae bacterium]
MNLFGTDGIRGVANDDLTPEMAFKLGLALGLYVVPGGRVGVAKDTRTSGDMLEAAVVAGLCASGCRAVTFGVLTTPGLSYLIRELGLDGGVMISASHNPGEFNGLKVFGSTGRKIDDSLEEKISAFILSDGKCGGRPTGNSVGRVTRAEGEVSRYVEFLAGIPSVSFSGLKVIVDCANGATGQVARQVWEKLGAHVKTINSDGDGEKINCRCGSTHPETLAAKMKDESFDVGFAHDGDGDRCIAVNPSGGVEDGDRILGVMAKDMKERGRLKGNTVVGTVMSNLGLELYLTSLGIRFVRTAVGDRYVLDEMDRGGYSLGGEQSGHIIFRDIAPAGDGIMTSLLLTEVLVRKGAMLQDLTAGIPSIPQVLVNVPVRDKNRAMESAALKMELGKARSQFGGRGRVFVRPSGTEPVIRVMVEAPEVEMAHEWARRIAEVIRSTETRENVGERTE